MVEKKEIENNLFKLGKIKRLKKGEVLHNPTDKCVALGRVEGGNLKFSRILSNGKEIVIREFCPGELFAELIVFTGEYYPGWLIASEDSYVTEVPLPPLLEYLKESDSLISFISGISQKLSHLSKTIEILSLKTIRQKIAYTLLLHQRSEFEIPPNISEYAVRLGCSREAVSRALAEMESEKIIIRDDKDIKIAQLELLEDLL